MIHWNAELRSLQNELINERKKKGKTNEIAIIHQSNAEKYRERLSIVLRHIRE